MGHIFCKCCQENIIWKIVSKQLPHDARILMLGLDLAAKTTILYKLQSNETITANPTVGFNVVTVSLSQNVTFTIWDVGGQDPSLWKHYFKGVEGLIYVVDSNDPSRMEESRIEFQEVLTGLDSNHIPILVLANKQDLPYAVKTSDVTQKLGLNELCGRLWHIQGTNALSGDGLNEGLDAFEKMVQEFQQNKASSRF